MPEGEEGKDDEYDTEESDHEEDESKDELDIMKERQFGTRKSARKRAQASALAFSSTARSWPSRLTLRPEYSHNSLIHFGINKTFRSREN